MTLPTKSDPDEQTPCPETKDAHAAQPAVPSGTQHPTLSLRHVAMLYYCFEHPDVSIGKMSDCEPFKGAVSKRTMENWAAADRWAERRREAQEQWASRLRKQLGDRFVEARLNHLKALERVFQKALQKLNADVVDCSSWEGLLSATGRLSAEVAKWHQLLENHLPVDQPQEHLRAKLSKEETEVARAAALAIIRVRREVHRKAMLQNEQANRVATPENETR